MVTASSTIQQVDVSQARLHLTSLGYVSGDPIAVTAFFGKSDPRKEQDHGRKADKLLFAMVNSWQREGRGIHFVVNGAHKKDDVKHGRALFCEHDNVDLEAQTEILEECGLPQPTFQVYSGSRSIHSYWVFDEPIDIERWHELQTDLLAHTQGDPALSNPNRNMRLAGSTHESTRAMAQIQNHTDRKFTFSELREVIPSSGKAKPLCSPAIANLREHGWHGDVPLESCLCRESRSLLEGVDSGGRNEAGAQLARDLIGTQNYLRLMRIGYRGDARELFEFFCSQCKPAITGAEIESIWRSAENDNPSPSTPAEGIDNCIKAWQRSQQVRSTSPTATPTANTNSTSIEVSSDDRFEVAASGAIAEYESILQEIEAAEQRAAGNENLFKWIVSRLLRDRGVTGYQVKELMEAAKTKRSADMVLQVLDAHDILDMEDEKQWLVMGVIPLSRVIGIAGTSGSGKTSLLYNIGKHVAIGSPWNQYEVSQGKVLVLQGDEPFADTRDKLRIARFRQDVPRGSFHFVKDWRFNQIKQLRSLLDEGNGEYRLIVIDSWYACHSGLDIDLNKPEAGNVIYNDLNKIAEDYNCTIAIIHHTSRSGAVSGSKTFENAVSELMVIKEPTKGDGLQKRDRILDIVKSRAGLKGEYLLAQNGWDYSWQHCGVYGADWTSNIHPSDLMTYFKTFPDRRFSPVQLTELDYPLAAIEYYCQQLQRWGLLESEWVVHSRMNGHQGYFEYRLSDAQRALCGGNFAPVVERDMSIENEFQEHSQLHSHDESRTIAQPVLDSSDPEPDEIIILGATSIEVDATQVTTVGASSLPPGAFRISPEEEDQYEDF